VAARARWRWRPTSRAARAWPPRIDPLRRQVRGRDERLDRPASSEKIMHTADGGESWHEQEKTLMEGTGIFDLLDLSHPLRRVHDRRPARPRLRNRGAASRATKTRPALGLRPDRGRVSARRPALRVLELPTARAGGGAAGEVMRHQPGRRRGSAPARAGLLTWLRGLSFSTSRTAGWSADTASSIGPPTAGKNLAAVARLKQETRHEQRNVEQEDKRALYWLGERADRLPPPGDDRRHDRHRYFAY